MGMLSKAQSGQNQAAPALYLDLGLYAGLEAIAKMREIDTYKLIEMQLQKFVRAYERAQVLKPTDTMPYGQYKGYFVSDVIKADPRYINYLLANSSNFALDTESIDLMNRLETEETPT